MSGERTHSIGQTHSKELIGQNILPDRHVCLPDRTYLVGQTSTNGHSVLPDCQVRVHIRSDNHITIDILSYLTVG